MFIFLKEGKEEASECRRWFRSRSKIRQCEMQSAPFPFDIFRIFKVSLLSRFFFRDLARRPFSSIWETVHETQKFSNRVERLRHSLVIDFFPFFRGRGIFYFYNNSVSLPLGMHEVDQAGRGTRGPDCPSIANGAQAAHVTGTPNVYRMDRTVFQVLQERSPACRDCRCGERWCVGRRAASSSCATIARVWRQPRGTTLDTTSSEKAVSNLRFRRLNELSTWEDKRPCIPLLIADRSNGCIKHLARFKQSHASLKYSLKNKMFGW